MYVTKAPDIDNCIKLVMDALQGVCYQNDYDVVHIDAAKIFDHTQLIWQHGQSEMGCTIIKISEISEQHLDEDCKCLSCKQKHQKI